ncbi:MAG TPA: condensation domain-containing protein, partial [Rhizomicrobium sp.]
MPDRRELKGLNVAKISIRSYPPMIANDRAACCPLTFQQERVLYFCELNPNSSIWDINTCKRLTGHMDPRRLAKAVERLAAWHQALRTRIVRREDGPAQFFDNDTARAFRHIDISTAARRGADEALAAKIAEICRKPISTPTYEEVLFEVVLLTLGETDSALLLRLHHIISDAASVDILWRDLARLYNGLARGTPETPPERIQYSDYAFWQRHHLGPDQTREQEEYWLGKFRDLPPPLDLPADAAPSPGLSFNGGLEIVSLPKDLVDDFQKLSWDRRVLPFSSLFAAYLVLLYKLCQQEDMAVGLLFSGRHYRPDLKDVVGFFVNLTAARVAVRPDCTFDQLVSAVHEEVEAAYFMQDYPFERLVQQLAPKRNDARMPLLHTMFNVVSNTEDDESLDGIETMQTIDVATQTNAVQVDLIFDIHLGSKDAEIRIEHNSDIFYRETVRRFADHFVTLLRALRSDWNIPLSRLELIDEAEKNRLLTGGARQSGHCVHEVFVQQVRRNPDKIALVDSGRKLTYAQLDQVSSRLADLLARHGVGPEKIVAVIGGRSADMVIGQLAILKAGGAYLPIAHSIPRARIREVLDDASPCVVLLADNCGHDTGFAGPQLRVTDGTNGAEHDHVRIRRVKPSNLAYVIY